MNTCSTLQIVVGCVDYKTGWLLLNKLSHWISRLSVVRIFLFGDIADFRVLSLTEPKKLRYGTEFYTIWKIILILRLKWSIYNKFSRLRSDSRLPLFIVKIVIPLGRVHPKMIVVNDINRWLTTWAEVIIISLTLIILNKKRYFKFVVRVSLEVLLHLKQLMDYRPCLHKIFQFFLCLIFMKNREVGQLHLYCALTTHISWRRNCKWDVDYCLIFFC